MNLNASTIFAGILFGAIGFCAFMYGKKQSLWKPMVLGIALMAYPYMVSNAVLLYVIGVFLTAALFIFRE